MKIVETDNFGSDYPNEEFVNLPPMCKHDADLVAHVINSVLCSRDTCDRFYKVVDDDYKLNRDTPV